MVTGLVGCAHRLHRPLALLTHRTMKNFSLSAGIQCSYTKSAFSLVRTAAATCNQLIYKATRVRRPPCRLYYWLRWHSRRHAIKTQLSTQLLPWSFQQLLPSSIPLPVHHSCRNSCIYHSNRSKRFFSVHHIVAGRHATCHTPGKHRRGRTAGSTSLSTSNLSA
jgi:hypothetical protein